MLDLGGISQRPGFLAVYEHMQATVSPIGGHKRRIPAVNRVEWMKAVRLVRVTVRGADSISNHNCANNSRLDFLALG